MKCTSYEVHSAAIVTHSCWILQI